MNNKLQALLAHAAGQPGLVGLFALASDSELRPIVDAVLAARPELLASNSRFIAAKDRPGNWPDLLATALEKWAAAGFLASLSTGAQESQPLQDVYAAVARIRARLGRVLDLEPVQAKQIAADELTSDASVGKSWLAWARDQIMAKIGQARHLPGAQRLGFAQMEPCNLLVVGKTGVGKSTLINAVLGSALAKTGIGQPVTQNAAWHESPDCPVRLLDTRGLEPGNYEICMEALHDAVISARGEGEATRQPHLAWLCIDASGRRIEPSDLQLAKALERFGIPVIVVLTKSWIDSEMPDQASNLIPQACRVVSVIAAAKDFGGGEVVKQAGLDNLADATNAFLPEGQRAAFAAAQIVLMQPKIDSARAALNASVVAAAAAATNPLPFSDAFIIVAIQVIMIQQITQRIGVTLEEAKYQALATALAAPAAAGFVGRAAATALGNLAKAVPGVGSIVGGAVNAAVAAALTRGLGEAYLQWLVEGLKQGRPIGVDDIVGFFKAKVGLS
jgi:uncharacterized protein (DUF697 family)/GTP-binding protein EngB required for normal cell division